jgi:nicotinamidase-related amidase
VSDAGLALANHLRHSGSRRVAFVGIAKNAGKTTALLAALEGLHRLGVPAGATSAGRDGEPLDLLTGEAKPRFRLFPGQLVATTDLAFQEAGFLGPVVRRLPLRTSLGAIEIRRARGAVELEVVGPATASGIAQAAQAMEDAGASIVLLDGAFSRRAFASLSVADGVVLSVGMSAAGTLEAVVNEARLAAELLRLRRPAAGDATRHVEGAVTDEALAANPPREGEVLVAEDFASIFLSEKVRRELAEQRVRLAVRRPARLLAVTANPTAPGRPALPAELFFEALAQAMSGLPVLDLHAGLRRGV